MGPRLGGGRMSARKFWSEWHNDWVQRSSVRGVDFARRLIMRLGKHCEDVEPEIYIRGWLIERARSKALREDLEEAVAMFEAYCEHWDGCPSKGLTHRNAKCNCGLRKDIETAKKWRRK